MCWGCVMSEMQEAGIYRMDVTDEMRRVGILIRNLYEREWGGAGGPLHVVVDDSNVEDRNLAFCRGEIDDWRAWDHDASYDEADRRLCHDILDGLEQMTIPQRSATTVLRGPHDWVAVMRDEHSIWPTMVPDNPPPPVTTTVTRTSFPGGERTDIIDDVDPSFLPQRERDDGFTFNEVVGRYPAGTDPRLAVREVMTEGMRRNDGTNDLPWWLQVTWWHGGPDGIRVGEDVVPPALTGRMPHVQGSDPHSVYVTQSREDAVRYATWSRSPMLYEVTFHVEPEPDDVVDDPRSFKVPKATVRKIHGLTRPEIEAALHEIFGELE